jgi:hypothetical protein
MGRITEPASFFFGAAFDLKTQLGTTLRCSATRRSNVL